MITQRRVVEDSCYMMFMTVNHLLFYKPHFDVHIMNTDLFGEVNITPDKSYHDRFYLPWTENAVYMQFIHIISGVCPFITLR